MSMDNASLAEPQPDPLWDDPLPHTHSPTIYYLSHPSRLHTKAAVIFMHGRGDDINDMVGVFLPILHRRFGGVEGRQEEDDEQHGVDAGPVALVGIEARDNVWYPESHNATEPSQVANNEPYQYSSLDKIRCTIISLVIDYEIPLTSIVLVGFSQGAILANTYLLAALSKPSFSSPSLSTEEEKEQGPIPLPAYILSLAGSLFKTPPRFPQRSYASKDHQQSFRSQLHWPLHPLLPPEKVKCRLLCGLADRHFPKAEIKDAAARLVEAAKEVKERRKIEVVVSVGLEEGAPHIVTPRMMAAVVESVEQILSNTM